MASSDVNDDAIDDIERGCFGSLILFFGILTTGVGVLTLALTTIL